MLRKMSLTSLLESGNLEGLASFCEEAELMAPQGVTTPEIYGCLLAVYLVQNELDHAKLLWKRIPGVIKANNQEISDLWEVGKRLWRKEFAEVYPLIENRKWPSNIEPLLGQLTDKLRLRVITLVGKAYSNVSLDHLSHLLGSGEDKTVSIITEKGWRVEGKVVYPKPPPVDFSQTEDSQTRLTELVSIVSFLEN